MLLETGGISNPISSKGLVENATMLFCDSKTPRTSFQCWKICVKLHQVSNNQREKNRLKQHDWNSTINMGVSKNNGTPKSSILIGFSIIFTIHFGGFYPYFWKQPYQGGNSTQPPNRCAPPTLHYLGTASSRSVAPVNRATMWTGTILAPLLTFTMRLIKASIFFSLFLGWYLNPQKKHTIYTYIYLKAVIPWCFIHPFLMLSVHGLRIPQWQLRLRVKSGSGRFME